MSANPLIAPESTAQRHSALPKVNGHLRPIAFPDRVAVEGASRHRANRDNERWQQYVERRDALVQAASKDAFDRGERAGYTQGWHWGCLHGLIAGGTAVGALWAAWPRLQALWATVMGAAAGVMP